MPTVLAWAGMRGVVSLAAALVDPADAAGRRAVPAARRAAGHHLRRHSGHARRAGTDPAVGRPAGADSRRRPPRPRRGAGAGAAGRAGRRGLAYLGAHPDAGSASVSRAHAHYTRVAARTKSALDELRATAHATHAEAAISSARSSTRNGTPWGGFATPPPTTTKSCARWRVPSIWRKPASTADARRKPFRPASRLLLLPGHRKVLILPMGRP